MNNYKVIICLVLIILLGLLFWRMNSKINSLEQDLLTAEFTISQQDNKIKEQLTEINLLMGDLEVRENTILALQEQINSDKLNIEILVNNMTKLDSISAVGEEIIIVNKTTVDEVNVVDNVTGQNFINLRNGIYGSYQ